MHFSSKVLWCHELNLHQVHFLPSGIPSTSFPMFPMFSDVFRLSAHSGTPPFHSAILLRNSSPKSIPEIHSDSGVSLLLRSNKFRDYKHYFPLVPCSISCFIYFRIYPCSLSPVSPQLLPHLYFIPVYKLVVIVVRPETEYRLVYPPFIV